MGSLVMVAMVIFSFSAFFVSWSRWCFSLVIGETVLYMMANGGFRPIGEWFGRTHGDLVPVVVTAATVFLFSCLIGERGSLFLFDWGTRQGHFDFFCGEGG